MACARLQYPALARPRRTDAQRLTNPVTPHGASTIATVSLTVQYDKMLFILEPNDYSRGLVRKRVTISDYQDGRLVIAHNARPLAYSIFDKVRQVNPAAIVDNKSLSAVLMKIREEQLHRPQRRSSVAPRRRSQENSIFSAPTPLIAPAAESVALLPAPPKPTDIIIEDASPQIERTDFKPIEFDFRCFNKFGVRKCTKSTAHRGRPRKKPQQANVMDFQKLADTAALQGDDAISAGLAFAEAIKRVA
jgi:hypothetical protein